MKSKITSIIMSFVIILIMIVFVVLGIMVWQEIASMQASIQPEDVKTELSISNNTDTKIENKDTEDNPFDQIDDNNNSEENNSNNNDNVNKFFYTQLDEYSKIIYKAFEANEENMRSGTYKVELGNGFSDLLNTENGQEELGKYYQSAIEAYTYDNPSVFYLDPNKMYLNIETTTKFNKNTYNVYVNNGNASNYLISEFSSKQEVDDAINKVEKVKNIIVQNRSGNDYDDIKMVHDYLVDNIQYDTSISKAHIYNLYGALINGEAVCEGYARSFKYLMDAMGIPCTIVIGKGTNSEGNTENHAWNYVQLDGTWYAIDTTWDDPVTTNGRVPQSTKYRYFLKGSNDMDTDHTPSGRFTDKGMMFVYPDLSIINY